MKHSLTQNQVKRRTDTEEAYVFLNKIIK
jgi:hypothetical protein